MHLYINILYIYIFCILYFKHKITTSSVEYIYILHRHCTMMSKDLPVDLLPFKHRLSPRFFEAREQVNSFIQNDVVPRLQEWNRY